MKLIDSSVSLIDIADPFMKIEKAGRTCYKSSSEMTEETAIKFYANLVSRKHFAMLEHATFCFEVTEHMYHGLYGHKYLNYSVEELDDGSQRFLISGNLRALNESQEDAILYCLNELNLNLVYRDFNNPLLPSSFFTHHIRLVNIDCVPNIQEHAYKKHKYLTFHFICDRGVTHEIVRHRPASYAQESTRYCNYSKDKYGNEITYIYPADFDNWDSSDRAFFYSALVGAEESYLALLNRAGKTPQEARAVLPNALKTEIIMTANCEEFDHFFDLRGRGTTGAPHPDMKRVADMALALYEENTKKFIK